MSDETKPHETSLPDSTESQQERSQVTDVTGNGESAAPTNGTIPSDANESTEVATDAPLAPAEAEPETKKKSPPGEVNRDESASNQANVAMTDEQKPEQDVAPVDESADPTDDTPASAAKAKAPARRKSGGVPEHKKKLNKKASKAKLTHTDAKPGDYFYVRLKGYPLWPGIICDEDMLPATLLKSRPVTAAKPDGTYREGYEDGGAKVKDRTFPVMYLHTNEFSWVPNYDLLDLDFETVGDVQPKMRKDLAAAHTLAAEQNELDYFKDVLVNFMEQKEADRVAQETARAEKKAKAAEKAAEKAANNKLNKKLSKAALVSPETDNDVEMADISTGADAAEAVGGSTKKSKNNNGKRPNEIENTPNDSSKKVKLNFKVNTPKTTNGAATPKSAKDSSTTKASKPKTKKVASKVAASPEAVLSKEPEPTAEEKRAKKEKEILFLRHKLQKGLLPRDQEPREDEMKQMSEFVTKLEGYAELEVSIIRATKINKVLKAILKLQVIPKEEEFQFKPRSQSLLDKWNKLLATEQSTPPVQQQATSNGASDEKLNGDDIKASPIENTNGSQEPADEVKSEVKEAVAAVQTPAIAPAAETTNEVPEAPPVDESTSDLPAEKVAKEPVSESTLVENTA